MLRTVLKLLHENKLIGPLEVKRYFGGNVLWRDAWSSEGETCISVCGKFSVFVDSMEHWNTSFSVQLDFFVDSFSWARWETLCCCDSLTVNSSCQHNVPRIVAFRNPLPLNSVLVLRHERWQIAFAKVNILGFEVDFCLKSRVGLFWRTVVNAVLFHLRTKTILPNGG